MANGNNGNGNGKVTWNIILPVGALGLLGSLMLIVAKDASIALDVVRQHGEEILLLRGEIHNMEMDVKDRTRSRYTSEDAARDNAYLIREIERLRKDILEHDEDHS